MISEAKKNVIKSYLHGRQKGLVIIMGLIGAIIVLAISYYGGTALMAFVDYKLGYRDCSPNGYKPSKKDITVDHEIDFRQAYIDVNTGKCSGKELKRRMNSGYYNKDK